MSTPSTCTDPGPPSTVLPPADPNQRRALDAALEADDPAGGARRCRRPLAPLPRRLGAPRRQRSRHDRALRLLPDRLPPRPRRAPGERLARFGLRPVGRREQPRVPASAARARPDGRRDRRDRRGRALRGVPGPTRARRRPGLRLRCVRRRRSSRVARAGGWAGTRRRSRSRACRWRRASPARSHRRRRPSSPSAGRHRPSTRHGLAVIGDDHPGEGPLGGILTAFGWSPCPVVVVVACDLVDLDADTVSRAGRARSTRIRHSPSPPRPASPAMLSPCARPGGWPSPLAR